MSHNRRPIHPLEHIKFITDNPPANDQARPLCDTFGVYHSTEIVKARHYWKLFDDTYYTKPIGVQLCGKPDEYPVPKRGDVVRIHRLTFDNERSVPIVTSPKNVLIWRSFKKEPEKVHTSLNPTIRDEDLKRQAELEACYVSTLTRLNYLQMIEPGKFSDVAGLITTIIDDTFNNKLVTVTDGTGTTILRVFKKNNPNETSEHFDTICNSKPGDYIVATNTKISSKAGETKLDISANTQYGRSIRKVDKESVLGRHLAERLINVETVATENNITSSSNDCNTAPIEPASNTETEEIHNEENDQDIGPIIDVTTIGASRGTISQPISVGESTTNSQQQETQEPPQLRRSARLQTRSNSNQSASSNSINTSSISPKRHSMTPPSNLTKKPPPIDRVDAKITQVSSLQKKPPGKFEYYNFVGQVRGIPNPALSYGNWIFQLYDGTKPKFPPFHQKYVDKAEENCIIIFVYSKQTDFDTDKHVNTVRTLQEGDLVYLKNIKVSWVDNKVRFELNANTKFDKGIKILNKDSEYGRQLLDKFATPSSWPEECNENLSQDSINDSSFLLKTT